MKMFRIKVDNYLHQKYIRKKVDILSEIQKETEQFPGDQKVQTKLKIAGSSDELDIVKTTETVDLTYILINKKRTRK